MKEKEEVKVALAGIEEQISVSVINSEMFPLLIENNLISLASESHFEYQMDEEEQSIWTMSGISHPLVVRIICFPPKQSILTKENLQATYELTLAVKDEYDRTIETYTQKLKLIEPNTEHKLYFHGYSQNQTAF
jgi:hypothetical protein